MHCRYCYSKLDLIDISVATLDKNIAFDAKKRLYWERFANLKDSSQIAVKPLYFIPEELRARAGTVCSHCHNPIPNFYPFSTVQSICVLGESELIEDYFNYFSAENSSYKCSNFEHIQSFDLLLEWENNQLYIASLPLHLNQLAKEHNNSVGKQEIGIVLEQLTHSVDGLIIIAGSDYLIRLVGYFESLQLAEELFYLPTQIFAVDNEQYSQNEAEVNFEQVDYHLIEASSNFDRNFSFWSNSCMSKRS